MAYELYFNDSTYITIDSAVNFTQDYTIEYIMKTAGAGGGYQHLWGNDITEDRILLWPSYDKVTVERSSIEIQVPISPVLIEDTEYTFKEVYNFSEGKLYFYVDDILQGTAIVPSIITLSNLRFGQFFPQAFNSFVGIIKEFKIYNNIPTLIYHWKIDDNCIDGGEITASVGGVHGTLFLGTGYWIETLQRGIQITGFKKDFPTTLSYNGNAVTLTPSDDSNTLATKLQALYAADAVIGGDVGALEVTTPATCDLHYTFEVTFSLLDAAAVPSSAEVQDGTSVFTEDSLTDAIIPMGHIDGIAGGRSRLIAWDEDDIIYNSAPNDLVDFLPSAETGANQVSVPALKGKITKCEGFTQGFVIYGTGNVVVATFSKSATSMYSFKPIEESEGLIDYRHLASAKDIHYYWSSKGLSIVTPEEQKSEFIAPELTDWVKKHRYPITVQLLSNRFLVIYLQDRDTIFSNRAVRNGGSTPQVGKAHADIAPVYFDYIAPGANLYPTYTRAILFDMQLQKWGSCDVANKLLISLTPYNQSGYQLAKNYQLMDAKLDNEQRELAIRLADEYTYLATTFPTDSYILFGKYATHRDKLTKLVYVDTEYVTYPDAEIEIEKSADGAKVDFTQNVSYATQTLLAKTQGFNLAGKWFNILIKGHYHLKRILVKGYTYGRKTN